MSNTQTLHFRIGADMGITLMQIAHEHLEYTQNLSKAVKTFTESFGGEVSDEIVKGLLTGDLIILVDEEDQMFSVVERQKHMHLDSYYPKLDLEAMVSKKHKRMVERCEDLDETLDVILNEFRYRKTYQFDFSVDAVVAYLYGDDEVMLEEIRDDYDLYQMQTIIRLTRDFIMKSMEFNAMTGELQGMYPELELKFNTYELLNLAQKVKDIGNLNFTTFTEGSDDILTSYMDAVKDIDTEITKGLEPVDIMDNYSAGWLSPGGDYYALNGEIANMLHTQISDALQKQGMIPKHENNNTDHPEINPDAWLEQQGWVKIHGNNVQFGGCLNDKLDKTNVNMTKKQIMVIKDYIDNCHQCMIKAGWRLEPTSIGMFTIMAIRNPEVLNKKYFTFD